MTNQEPSLNCLDQSNYQTYNRNVARILGDVTPAILLQELIDRKLYHERHPNHNPLIYDGKEWWYETHETVEERTGLKRKSQDRAIKILEEHGLIKKITKGLPQKRFFNLNHRAILELYNRGVLPSEDLKFESLNCPNGTKQFVQNGQIELSKTDKLETSQVSLGKNDRYIDYEPNNEPKEKLASYDPSDLDLIAESPSAYEASSPDNHTLQQKKQSEAIMSQTQKTSENANIRTKSLKLLENLGLNRQTHERIARVYPYADLVKAVELAHKRKGEIEDINQWLTRCLQFRYWEEKKETQPETDQKYVKYLKNAYKALSEHNKIFNEIIIKETEIVAQNGLKCVMVDLVGMNEDRFYDEMAILHKNLEDCGLKLEVATIGSGKVKTFKIRNINENHDIS